MEKTIVDLFKILENMYEKFSVMNKIFFIRYLFDFEMSDGGFSFDYINEFNMVFMS